MVFSAQLNADRQIFIKNTIQYNEISDGIINLKDAVRQLELLDLIVEPDEFKVFRIVNSTRQPLELPKLSFELLLYLMAHAEKVCSLEQISAAVWKNTVVTDDTITQRITLLRKALDDDPKQPKYIESVRGRGYRLLASPVECAAVASFAATTLATPASAEPALSVGKWVWVLLADRFDFFQVTVVPSTSPDQPFDGVLCFSLSLKIVYPADNLFPLDR